MTTSRPGTGNPANSNNTLGITAALKPAVPTPPVAKELQPTGYRVLDRFIATLENTYADTAPVSLDFSWFALGNQGLVKLVDKVLSSKLCPADLSINLKGNNIDSIGFKVLLDGLANENCPTNLKLNLSCNAIFNNDVLLLAAAIKTGKCPAGLELDLTEIPFFGTTDVKVLKEALESSKSAIVIKFDKKLVDAYETAKKILAEKEAEKAKLAEPKTPLATFNIHAKIATHEIKNNPAPGVAEEIRLTSKL